ncbi:MAG: potassium channel family protein [Phycisphaerales bacterium]
MNQATNPVEPATNSGTAAIPARGTSRTSAVQLLVALVVELVGVPLVQSLPAADLVEAALLTVVMVFAVLAVGGRHRDLAIALGLLVPTLVCKWLNHFRPDLIPAWPFLLGAMCLFGFVVARLLAFIVRAKHVDANVLCAGLSGFLMLGLLWMPPYLAVARADPQAFIIPTAPGAPVTFDGFSAYYFSFITLCTVGYGDIVPVAPLARALAVMEGITGLFYMAVMISRLVAMYTTALPPDTSEK